MGQRASDTRGISFEDVEVPAEVIIYGPRLNKNYFHGFQLIKTQTTGFQLD